MIWIHIKCNSTSNKEYDLLVLEDNSTLWQCIFSNIEEMTAKFLFTHSANIELNDLYDLDFPSQLQLLPSSKNKYFSLFHVNAKGLSKNFDQLLSILAAAGISFDVLEITETKEQIGKAFTTNVNVDEYHMYTQPTKSTVGGVAIYANDKLDHFETNDLRI